MMRPMHAPIVNNLYGLISSQVRSAYLVGGIVRDQLLGRSSQDIDICLDCSFDQMKSLRRTLEEAMPEAHIQFVSDYNNIRLKLGEFKVDLVPFRKETYSNESNRPQIEEGTFIDDVLRRDFTVNSIYQKIKVDGSVELIDPLGGIADIERRVLRLNYAGSFSDDPTRMIRLFVYGHRLGFTIEPQTAAALDKDLMVKVGLHQLIALMRLVIAEENSDAILSSLISYGLLETIGILHPTLTAKEETLEEKWQSLLLINPQLIKTFEDLGIYSKLVRKIREG